MNRIGIIGAGQLGQMLGFAALKLGLECVFLDPSDDPPAAAAGPVIKAAFDDCDALQKLADECDVITYEFENVPVGAVRSIESRFPVLPPTAALEKSQDRLTEKQLFDSLHIPLPAFKPVDSEHDLQQATIELGLPMVLKTRRLGYDGKGQAIIKNAADAATAFEALGGSGLIAEEFVRFEHEISVIGVRSVSGQVRFYPLSQNEHKDGILRVSRAPADSGSLAYLANLYLERLLTDLNYVGILALELFVIDKRLLANEYAPRVHNSGHWTIEGARASQFENHIRAVTGLPLADTAISNYPAMVNIIGRMPDDTIIIEEQDAILHDYGKSARPGRKLGHVTVIGSSAADRDERIARLCKILAC